MITWKHHWKRIAPLLTNRWETVAEISRRTGIARSPIGWTLAGAVEEGLVQVKYERYVPGNHAKTRALYRKLEPLISRPACMDSPPHFD